MNRIDRLFQSGKKDILSVYFTAGYPKLDDTVKIIKSLSDDGVDMIEIGVPFSDPMADGPVIQASGQQALRNGMTQKLLFQQLQDIRQETDIPLIAMSYVNTAMQFGFEKYCKACAEVGIDGLIIPDLPMDDKAYFINAFFEVDTVELGCESARELQKSGNLFTSLEAAKNLQKVIYDTLYRQGQQPLSPRPHSGENEDSVRVQPDPEIP
jgi:tryptophan synthase alpha subunit